jgi:hypothetical protein
MKSVNRSSINVVFVVGVAHSGTTILYRLLGRHPDLAWFSQFSQRHGRIPERTPVPFGGLYNRLARKVFEVPWKKQRDWTEYIVPRPMEANSIWRYLLPEKLYRKPYSEFYCDQSDVSDTDYERFGQVFSSELSRWNRDHIICKLPRLTRAVTFLDEIFPSATFIHLLRDGRAVSLSNQHKFETSSKSEEEALSDSAEHWRTIVNWVEGEALPELSPERQLTLKLEEFQQEPETTFRNVLKFLDLDEKQYPWPLPSIKDNTNRKWKKAAPPSQIKFLEEYLRTELNWFDYRLDWQ